MFLLFLFFDFLFFVNFPDLLCGSLDWLCGPPDGFFGPADCLCGSLGARFFCGRDCSQGEIFLRVRFVSGRDSSPGGVVTRWPDIRRILTYAGRICGARFFSRSGRKRSTICVEKFSSSCFSPMLGAHEGTGGEGEGW